MADELQGVLDGFRVRERARRLWVYPQVLAQLLDLRVRVLDVAWLAPGELLIMAGEIREPRRHHAGRALVVPVLDALGRGGALEQLQIAVDFVEIPVAGIFGLEFRAHFVDHGALVGEKRRVVVACTLHDRPALIFDREQPGDKGADVGSELDQQLRDRNVAEIRALAVPVPGIGPVQIRVGATQGRVESSQQLCQALGAKQIAIGEPVYAEGKIP